MFFQLTKYSLLRTIRTKSLIFWCFLFPVMLGTMFKVTFGDFTNIKLSFRQISVAYVEEEGARNEFSLLVKTLEQEEELIKIVKVEKQEAEKMLRDNEVEGIYINGNELRLIVTEEEINQSILKNILEQYERTSSTLINLAKSNPEAMEKAVQTLADSQNFVKETNITENKMDYMLNYFYALLAMSCLYGSFMGLEAAIEFKADLSSLGARRCVASSNRFLLLMSDIISKIITQFFCAVIAMSYLIFVLKVQLGNQFGLMCMILLAGSMMGVSLGVFIGAIGKMQKSIKEGICVSISMLFSFFAGLMIEKMYQMVEANAPIINRVNPAALIVNAFYSLNIYSDYSKFIQCILSLCILAGLLWIGVFLIIRRERYASI